MIEDERANSYLNMDTSDGETENEGDYPYYFVLLRFNAM